MVKGLRIEFIDEVLTEVTGLPYEGEKWAKFFDLWTTRAQFSVHFDPPLDIYKKQGLLDYRFH